jgi:DNA-binding MarR family transcriptional regulator/N-acetylglutamate synthase-like GNAT family acetyltransferase
MDAVDAVRRFNRFYTRHVGALGEHLLDSPYSLTEMRVLYELAHRDGISASDLTGELGLDAGYLSRILARFQTQRLIARDEAPGDARRAVIRLTAHGRNAFAPYEQKTRDTVAAMLDRLAPRARRDVVDAMQTLHIHLDPAVAPAARAYVLRTHQPGDLGWIVQMHGALYAREYGYDASFEAVVARIAADFLDHLDTARERCWIAEVDGVNVGSVCLVKKTKTVAKLRLLIVDPSARGLGIGRRLVDECIRFARQAGYRKITLWTHGHLAAARKIYEATGFACVDRQPSTSFGKKLVDETWELRC